MIDRYVFPLQGRLLQPVARHLARRGVSADAITVGGFAIGLLAAPLLATGRFEGALVVILANRVLDGLDGAVARATRPTDRGAFIDIAFDFFFYATVPLGFALLDPLQNGSAATALTVAFVGTGSSFLAFAAIAAKRGLTAASYPQKGLYFLGGLAEGAETIAVFVALCVWPSFFPQIALAYAAVCMVTAVSRWTQGWVVFSRPAPAIHYCGKAEATRTSPAKA